MKIVLRIFLSIFFVPLFALFLILTTLKFQVLNYTFIIESFQSNKVYDKLQGFLKAVSVESKGETHIDLTPVLAQQIVEANLKEILSFANGQSKDILLSIPEQEKISVSKLMDNRVPKTYFEHGQRAGEYSLYAWIVCLILLIGLIYTLFRLGKKDKWTELFFIVIFLIFIILGLLARFFLMHMATDLVKGVEPAQHLLAILASSIFPEIINTWIFITVFLAIISITVLMLKKK